jgi:hypothetical protein
VPTLLAGVDAEAAALGGGGGSFNGGGGGGGGGLGSIIGHMRPKSTPDPKGRRRRTMSNMKDMDGRDEEDAYMSGGGGGDDGYPDGFNFEARRGSAPVNNKYRTPSVRFHDNIDDGYNNNNMKSGGGAPFTVATAVAKFNSPNPNHWEMNPLAEEAAANAAANANANTNANAGYYHRQSPAPASLPPPPTAASTEDIFLSDPSTNDAAPASAPHLRQPSYHQTPPLPLRQQHNPNGNPHSDDRFMWSQ